MKPSHLQREWIEQKMSTPMRVNSHQMGLPVDYKLDVGGVGVFFVVHCQDARGKNRTEYDAEVYRMFPAGLRPSLKSITGASDLLAAELRARRERRQHGS